MITVMSSITEVHALILGFKFIGPFTNFDFFNFASEISKGLSSLETSPVGSYLLFVLN